MLPNNVCGDVIEWKEMMGAKREISNVPNGLFPLVTASTNSSCHRINLTVSPNLSLTILEDVSPLVFRTGEILANGFVLSSHLHGIVEKSHTQQISFMKPGRYSFGNTRSDSPA